MTIPSAETEIAPVPPPLEDQEWRDPEVPPPTNLPYDDGDKMESPWHQGTATLILANYAALCGGRFETSYAGANMFLYYSSEQARNRDYRGPDAFIVKEVDGTRQRLSWIIWEEGGRYPDVLFELLSASTEREDLVVKKQIYEHVFRTPEYFCIAPQVERLLGWRLQRRAYVPIEPDARGWLWSEELGVWLGAWQGLFLGREDTWLRFYQRDGELVLLGEEAAQQRAEAAQQEAEAERQRAEAERQRAEAAQQEAAAERQRAETERQRAEELAARVAALEAQLTRQKD